MDCSQMQRLKGEQRARWAELGGEGTRLEMALTGESELSRSTGRLLGTQARWVSVWTGAPHRLAVSCDP